MAGRSGSCNAVAVARLVHGDFEGTAEPADTLLSMGPAFEHDVQPASSNIPSASHTTSWKDSTKGLESLLPDKEVNHVSHKDIEPYQDESCSQPGSQVAGSQDASALLPEGSPVVEDFLPLPEASVVEDPPPSPSHADGKGDTLIQAGATAATSVVDQGDSPGSAEQAARSSQLEPAADVSPEEEPHGAPEGAHEPKLAESLSATELELFSGHGFSTADAELLNNLHITAPAESEEEVFHDAGSGFESSAQHTGASSRRVSTDSELIWPLYNSAGNPADPGFVHYQVPRCLNSGVLDQ